MYIVDVCRGGMAFPDDASKEPACQCETGVGSLGLEDPLEESKATHSSILAWGIPWTEDPGRVPSVGSQSRAQLK